MNYLDELHNKRREQANDSLKDSYEADHVGKVVEVYYNSHRGSLSVRDAKTKKVFAHSTVVALKDVTFTVQPAGRDKVRRENKKNVHAWVRGTVMAHWAARGYESWDDWLFAEKRNQCCTGARVKYNPYVNDSFVVEDTEEPISKAKCVMVYATGGIEILEDSNG
tara:strand:+ start:1132 stop:1626 length:495 start_codon:yes stop_codon:yes gene_type:complete